MRTNLSETEIKSQKFSFKKMHMEMSSVNISHLVSSSMCQSSQHYTVKVWEGRVWFGAKYLKASHAYHLLHLEFLASKLWGNRPDGIYFTRCLWAHNSNLARICGTLIKKKSWYQFTNCHMSRQLNCRDMCKFVNWYHWKIEDWKLEQKIGGRSGMCGL